MKEDTLDTAKGTRVRVLEGGEGTPVVFLHGVAGLLEDTSFLDALAQRHHVFAPELPGYGASTGEELLEDMLDFALHGWDVVRALGLSGARPHIVGHSLGGMVAAEMACLAPEALDRLVLVDPFGLWMDEHPVTDLFSLVPFEFPGYLFHDPEKGGPLLAGGIDFSSDGALTDFMVANARRLGLAGKVLFPVPNRRLSKRLYRMQAETLVVWGESDRLIPPVYAKAWHDQVPGSRLAMVPEAGHMVLHEQPERLADEVLSFLGGSSP